MPSSISVEQLSTRLHRSDFPVVIDVRKEPAFAASGRMIAGALRRRPEQTETWCHEFTGSEVVVYCVYGHEVSQDVCALLESHGSEAVYLEGGFEAWRKVGGHVQSTGAEQ